MFAELPPLKNYLPMPKVKPLKTEGSTMTNAIEQTKREMYEHWKSVSKLPVGVEAGAVLLGFETAFETHLEELRKALAAVNSATVACAQNSAKAFIDHERRLSAMTEERDSIQLRLHAVDHTYKEQQERSATPIQESGDRGASEQAEASAAVILGAVGRVQSYIWQWGMGECKAKQSMRRIAGTLNSNPEVIQALSRLKK